MLVYCWSIVFDAGPALNQHWVNDLWSNMHYIHALFHRSTMTMVQCCRWGDNYLANTIHWSNAGPLLGRRRRRRANIGPALGNVSCLPGRRIYQLCSLVTYSLILTISFFIAMHHCLHQDFEPGLVRCNVGPASQTVYQLYANTGSTSCSSHSSWTTRAHLFFS